MATTLLSTLLNRESRYQSLAATQEIYKVQDLDEAIRTVKRNHRLPFLIKKSTLRVFSDVILYPVATDHDYLLYMDTSEDDVPYGGRMRARYTSLQQFYEDLDYRNVISEIWDTNTLILGIRDKNVPPGMANSSQTLDEAGQISNYTASLNANTLALDTVLFKTGNSSIRFINTNTTNDALVSWTFSEGSFTNANYLRNYFFVWVYLTGAPTSIKLRFGVSSSNYLTTTVTQQFSGQALKVNDWNLLAFDCNTATTVGTINTSSVFNYGAVELIAAPTGFYNIDASYLREWSQLDYWYYSKYMVQTNGATVPDQEYFINESTQLYSTDSSLAGDHEWSDVILYEAMLRGLSDKENETLYAKVQTELKTVYAKIYENLPDSKPLMTTQSMRFQTDFTNYPDGTWPY